MKENKKSTCIIMLPITFRRLKMLAVKRGLSIGNTISLLLDTVDPMPIDEQIMLMEVEHIE